MVRDPRSSILDPQFSSLDQAARAVLERYPGPVRQGSLVPLGNRGGFSGARLWRTVSPLGPLCLRAWPPHDSLERVLFRHRLMARARGQGLHFVPTVLATRSGDTTVDHADRLWELTEWLPGRADYHERPSPERLAAACRALALLHTAWEPLAEAAPAPCPALERRLDCVRDWHQLLQSGGHPLARAAADDPARPVAERAWNALARWAERVPGRLQPWAAARWRLQPCLCDLWHDHLLFEGGRLTGVVDYGAVKVDQVAVDLARMLGSLVADDDGAWQAGLCAYREARALSPEEEGLARALDETGTVLGMTNWLRWLYEERRPFEDRAAAGRRLLVLVERVERWGPAFV
jgi:homoserine kinase type II